MARVRHRCADGARGEDKTLPRSREFLRSKPVDLLFKEPTARQRASRLGDPLRPLARARMPSAQIRHLKREHLFRQTFDFAADALDLAARRHSAARLLLQQIDLGRELTELAPQGLAERRRVLEIVAFEPASGEKLQHLGRGGARNTGRAS
jgi:hypothetical protein